MRRISSSCNIWYGIVGWFQNSDIAGQGQHQGQTIVGYKKREHHENIQEFQLVVTTMTMMATTTTTTTMARMTITTMTTMTTATTKTVATLAMETNRKCGWFCYQQAVQEFFLPQ